jgi:hypothetical protein
MVSLNGALRVRVKVIRLIARRSRGRRKKGQTTKRDKGDELAFLEFATNHPS